VTSAAAVAVAYAISKISPAPYLWGGNGPIRFDCSGLTSAAWSAAGVSIPRTAVQQLHGLPRVSLSSIQPGDLVVYSFSGYADHVALYVGSGRTVDTASHHPNGGVGYSSLQRAGGTIAGVVRPNGPTTRSSAVRTQPRAVSPHVEAEGGQPVAANTHHVVAGEWLSRIARRYGTTWQHLYALNRDRIKNPDLIYPGQVLRLPASAG
jgi:nucleoid-associated protein YgaU